MSTLEAAESPTGPPPGENPVEPEPGVGSLAARAFAGSVVAVTLVFLGNNHLTFWMQWPGVPAFLVHQGWMESAVAVTLEGTGVLLGWLQFSSYPASVLAVIAAVLLTRNRLLRADADILAAFAAYIIRAAFWSVVIVGIADVAISFLRVEGILDRWVGEALSTELGKPAYRGKYVHWPLVAVSCVIAFFIRGLGFTWLALLVVVAEFQIVISRFVFSYEQGFMGDLVRFWYAALFLFASAHALIDDGHVRVDVLYAHFSNRGKAWTNSIGSVFLGIPLCWVILTQGMWTKGSSLNSPLLSFEISQSGFGMYTKYMMAGFLVIFALSMTIQFASYFLDAVADLRDEPGHKEVHGDAGLVLHR
ncbi:MAG: TRAP transporter small permease subunit [Gammaproteobacteria bacterium]|nr:TRAP transporter small permease subunit [Gammaproteobacteria bacterium]